MFVRDRSPYPAHPWVTLGLRVDLFDVLDTHLDWLKETLREKTWEESQHLLRRKDDGQGEYFILVIHCQDSDENILLLNMRYQVEKLSL